MAVFAGHPPGTQVFQIRHGGQPAESTEEEQSLEAGSEAQLQLCVIIRFFPNTPVFVRCCGVYCCIRCWPWSARTRHGPTLSPKLLRRRRFPMILDFMISRLTWF